MRRSLGTIVVVSVVAGRAHAQSNDTGSLAEQLFNQARDLTKAGAAWGDRSTEVGQRAPGRTGRTCSCTIADSHVRGARGRRSRRGVGRRRSRVRCEGEFDLQGREGAMWSRPGLQLGQLPQGQTAVS
jgi:hypothetical protein